MPALAAFVVILAAVGAVVFVTSDSGSDAAAAEETALSFIEARNAYDADTAIALLASDAVIDGPFLANSLNGLREDTAFNEATGWLETVEECTANPTSESIHPAMRAYNGTEVTCPFSFENAWSDALGVNIFPGSSKYRFVVADNLIIYVMHDVDTGTGFNSSVWQPFQSWISANHPVDVPVLYNNQGVTPRKTPDAIATWKQRTDEFVAEQGG